MRLPTSRQVLICMSTMSFKPPLTARDSSNERHGCINQEDAAQDRPHLERIFAALASCQTEHRQGKAKKSATGISHEDSCRRPVPTQKAQAGCCETDHGCRQSGSAAL